MAAPSNEDNIHYIFKTNPLELNKYVYKQVEVITTNNKHLKGFVYTVDPVSGSFILMQIQDDKPNHIELVMGPAVKEIQIVESDEAAINHDIMDSIFMSHREKVSPAEIIERKSNLKAWFTKNRIPVAEVDETSGILSIMNSLQIHPPYAEENCFSANEIILGRVQTLIRSMPQSVSSVTH